MKIGIDARPLQGETQYRGIGKALEFLLGALVKQTSPSDEFVYYIDRGLPVPNLLAKLGQHRVIEVQTSRLGRTRYVRSVLPSYKPIKPRPRDIDVFLQYDTSLGVPTTVPTLTMFHDLIPLLFHSQEKRSSAKGTRRVKNALASRLYWNKYLRTLNNYKRAEVVAAISESSKADLLKHIKGVKPAKVIVIPLGTNQNNTPATGSKKIKKLAAKPYILYVGGIDLRKNIVELLKTFYALKPSNPELRLICVGKEFNLDDQMSDLGWFEIYHSRPEYSDDVLIPGFLSNDEVLYLYQHARTFVFPSRYEGFGMPVIEAMQSGCPVVAYSNSSIPEVAGKAALLAQDNESLAPLVQKLLSSPSLRNKLIAKGKEQAKLYSWDRTATLTLKALRKAAKQNA